MNNDLSRQIKTDPIQEYCAKVSIIACVALVPILPYVIFGYNGHDYLFHLYSWCGIHQHWASGQLIARWDNNANYGLGDPHFSFYPPLSSYLGSLLTFLLPLKIVPAAFVWTVLFMSGVSMFFASRDLVLEQSRLPCALLYMLNPYLLMTVIVRFAAAEALVQAWLPLLILHSYCAIFHRARTSLLPLAALWAITWLTNIPLAVTCSYCILCFALVQSIRDKSVSPLWFSCLGEAFGIFIAGFRLIPAFVDSHWISPSALYQFGYLQFQNSFIFAPLSRIPAKVPGLSYWLIGIGDTILIVYLYGKCKSSGQEKQTDDALATLTVIAFLFQLPLTTVLWNTLPGLRFVQFPYRFLAILGVLFPLALLRYLRSPRNRKLALAGVIAISLMLPTVAFVHLRGFFSFSKYPAIKDVVHQMAAGYPGAPEYLPTSAVELGPSAAALPVAEVVSISSKPCHIELVDKEPERLALSTDCQESTTVRLRQYFYPSWHSLDERGHEVFERSDDHGLLLLFVPSGRHHIQVSFDASSPIRSVSNLLSLVSVCILIGLLVSGYFKQLLQPTVESPTDAVLRA